MSESHSSASDPFAVLGLPANASLADVRSRYLELVRRHSPESDPERFQQIQQAYNAASDPMTIARRLTQPPGDPLPWKTLLDQEKQNPPRVPTEVLLSLGNQTTGSRNE
ncbi:J domain-containing protein [Roseimaritima sediminicola]|uniref:J domain-containing protein n=1 Tax=Roseimaritima sediminicola TaxID=2662066 RepID=UPI0013872134|nr:J domain-containing protein [Roseimaritima sediminicola]